MLIHCLRRCPNLKATLVKRFVHRLLPSKHETFKQCWPNVDHRLRRWPNINATSVQRLVYTGHGGQLFSVMPMSHKAVGVNLPSPNPAADQTYLMASQGSSQSFTSFIRIRHKKALTHQYSLHLSLHRSVVSRAI